MTSWTSRAGFAIVLLVSLGSPGWADTTATHFTVHGDTATAEFLTTSPSNACIQFFVVAVASDQMEKTSPDGGPIANVGTVLIVTERDVCRLITILSGEGETAQQSLRIAGNLSTATLDTTVMVSDVVTGEVFTFAVHLTWTALGPPERTHETERFQDKDLGILVVRQLQSTKVEAEAMGTVVGLGLNFTPAPSTSAELDAQTDGTVIVQMTH